MSGEQGGLPAEPAHVEGETLGQFRARHGLPGTDTGAARALTWRDGLWRDEQGAPATSAARYSEPAPREPSAPTDELARLLPALRGAIDRCNGSRNRDVDLLARACSLLLAERERVSAERDRWKALAHKASADAREADEAITTLRARVAELEARVPRARWLALTDAQRRAQIADMEDRLADVRHELSAENIKVWQALIDLAKGAGE